MLDLTTGETLLQVSIYNISYCSADAAHDHVFAFVGTVTNPEAEVKEMCFRKDAEEVEFDGPLICYAFLCQKRKMAQTVTLTVARSFERAYQIWQSKQFNAERKRKELAKLNSTNRAESSNSGSSSTNGAQRDEISLLIDFNSDLTAEICSKDHRELLQNTWVIVCIEATVILKFNAFYLFQQVSFEDDQSQEFFAVPNLNASNGWSRTAICSN